MRTPGALVLSRKHSTLPPEGAPLMVLTGWESWLHQLPGRRCPAEFTLSKKRDKVSAWSPSLFQLAGFVPSLQGHWNVGDQKCECYHKSGIDIRDAYYTTPPTRDEFSLYPKSPSVLWILWILNKFHQCLQHHNIKSWLCKYNFMLSKVF